MGTEIDVLVAGAGPAGLAAAIEVRKAGLRVAVIEQRETSGGAIFRQAIESATPIRSTSRMERARRSLFAEFVAMQVPVRYASILLGIDGDGLALIEDRAAGGVRRINAKAVVLALGAVEKILPRPGWQHAGVSTAGGLQVMMKERGQAPAGRVVLAGSGPLLIAVAAQMAMLGNPPVAVIEAGDPLRRFAAGAALATAHPRLAFEAAGYLAVLRRHRVAWWRGATLQRIERDGEALAVCVRARDGAVRFLAADRVGLHDGIAPNDFGLPDADVDGVAGPIVLRAGDCREALGADAAIADGRAQGKRVVALLGGAADSSPSGVDKFRDAQAILAQLFAPIDPANPLAVLPDDTPLCRCENRTIGDLKALCAGPDALTGREAKHQGRFAMGSCQGRFCAANTAALMALLRPDRPAPRARDLTGTRWPIRPVPIAALTRKAAPD